MIVAARAFSVVDCDQRSPEWFAARLGRVTSSTAAKMLSQPRSKADKESVSRRNLRVRLALERVTGRPVDEDGYQSNAMKDGIEREPDAFAYYEALTGRLLERTGFLRHDVVMAGASLDAHCDDFTGIVEIKAPTPAVHMEYLTAGVIPKDYYTQVIHSLWVTGAEWCDWVSYQPDFPEWARVKVVRVERNAAELDAYALALSLFLSEVDAEVERIRALRA